MTREGISPRGKTRARVAGEEKVAKKHGPVRESAFSEMRKSQKTWPCARIGISADAKASLSAASGRSGLGAVSDHVRRRAHWHGNAEVSQGLNCVAGAAFWQGRVQISWQAQHFQKVRCRFQGRRSTFARSSVDFVAGAALSQGQVPNSWQAQHFRKVKYRFRGRRSRFARSSAKFVAGAALSQGQVQISWQAQHVRKVKRQVRGRRSTFTRSSTDFVAGTALSLVLAQIDR